MADVELIRFATQRQSAQPALETSAARRPWRRLRGLLGLCVDHARCEQAEGQYILRDIVMFVSLR
jgi:hypothetical protein